MSNNQIDQMIRSVFCDDLQVVKSNDGYKVRLPITDYLNSPVEALISVDNDQITIDDMGHTAGLLFELSQHGEGSPGFQLAKRLAQLNSVEIKYNEGTLVTSGKIDDIKTPLLNFLKTIISLQNVLPEIKTRKRDLYGHRSLRARLSRDITQLKMVIAVQMKVEIEGKYEKWPVDYRYIRGENSQKTEILIVTANLALRDPRQKAEHILTLASDVLDTKKRRALRVVYDVDGNGRSQTASRAVALIENYQERVGYKAYNYSNRDKKAEISALTTQDLASFSLLR
ncbi:hypothetical protein ES705_18597 [subsurface metagenome]